MERDEIKSILESLLFVADGPQSVQRLAEVLDPVDKELIHELIHELRQDFEAQNRGIRLVEVAGGYQLSSGDSPLPLTLMQKRSRNFLAAGLPGWAKRRWKPLRSSPTASPSLKPRSKRSAVSTWTALSRRSWNET